MRYGPHAVIIPSMSVFGSIVPYATDHASMVYYDSSKFESEELGFLFEMYANGASISNLARQFSASPDTIYQYIRKYYYGEVPKAFKTTITLKSKL